MAAASTLPTLSISDAQATEGALFVFILSLSVPASEDVPVTCTASFGSGDTAVAGDLTFTSANATFRSGQNATSCSFRSVQDTTDEEDETFTVTLSTTSSNAQLATDPTAKGTILDDDTAPTVTGVAITSTPALETDTYGAGETIRVTVTFSEAVTVTGDPEFAFSLDSGEDRAPYKSGSGTTALVFAYTVAPGDEDDDGIFLLDGSDFNNRVGPVTLDSDDAIKSTESTTDADLAHTGRGTESGHKVDGSRSIVSVEVTSTPLLESDTYGAGETIQFTVTFNVPVDVDGDPVLEFLFDGSEVRQASDVSGDGTTELVFSYTVVSGDDDDNGLFLRDESDYDSPDGPVRLDSDDEIEFHGTSTDAPLYWAGRGTQSGHKVDGSRTTGNVAPSFTSSAAFDATENQTAAGTVVAADSDADDSVTGYAITGGADMALFEIGATSGELTFKSAPNFEDAQDQGTNNTYVVDVTATSGADTRVMTATQTITVTVTDVDTEAPGKPGAPTVSAASASSLSVSWSAPDNAGPAITDYDYRHRTTSPQGSWTEVTGTTITTLSATIGSLAENTSYDVQVRATNDEGTGAWSDAGSGSTDAAPSDDCPENNTTTCVVDVGGSVTGEIDQALDVDWFAVDLESGTRYQFDVEGADTGRGNLADPHLWGLYDAEGQAISGARSNDGGVGKNGRVIYTSTADGTYYIAVSGAVSTTGTYTLSVIVLGANGVSEADTDCLATTATTCRVEVGASATGNIGEFFEEDWFRVDLEAGKFYQIDLEGAGGGGGTLVDPYLRNIRNSSGNAIEDTENDDVDADNDLYDSRIIFTPAAAGVHYLVVSDADAATGTYTLSVREFTPPCTPDDDDIWCGKLTVGQVLSDSNVLTAYGFSGVVGRSAGGLAGYPDDTMFTVGDNDYTIQSVSVGLQGGSNAGSLFFLLTADLSDDDKGNLVLTIDDVTTPRAFDDATKLSAIGLYTWGSTGLDWSSTPEVTVRLQVTPPAADDYPADTTTTGEVAVGGSVTGNIETAGDADWFKVVLEAGKKYQFKLEGAETTQGTLSDPYLSLYDGSSNEITNNDDISSTNLNSEIVQTLTAAGTYYLEAKGATTAATGTYTLSVNDITPASDDPVDPPDDPVDDSESEEDDLPADTTTTGEVEVGGAAVRGDIYKPVFVERTGDDDVDGYDFDTDWFKVDLEADKTYRIDMWGENANNDLTLHLPQINAIYDADGDYLVNTWSSDESEYHYLFRVTFHVHDDGAYYIAASGESFEWGTYKLTVIAITEDDDEDTAAQQGQQGAKNLRAVEEKGGVRLTWQPPDGVTVTGYRIERRRAGGQGSGPQRSHGQPRDHHTLVEDTGNTETSYVDESAEQGVEYEYRVTARNESGPGESSDWVRAGPEEEPVLGDGLPGAPRNLTATPGNKEVTLSWDLPDDNGNAPATRYRIEWRVDGKDYDRNDWGTSQETTYTTNAQANLANGVKYVFRVKAGNDDGNSYGPYGPASEEVSATPTSGSAVDLGTPVLSDTENLHHRMVQLDWQDIEDAGWYVVQYYHVEDGEWLDLPAEGVDIAFHGSSAVVSNLHGLSWLRVGAASCDGASEWSQIEELYGTNASDWEGVPVPEVEEGDEIEPCPVVLGTPVLSDTEILHHGMVQLDWQDIEDAGWYVVQYYHLEDEEWLDLPAEGVDIAFHGSSAVVSNLHGLSWLRVGAASCDGASEWSQIEESYGTNASDWKGVPVPEVAEGDEIEPCSEDADTPENSLATGAPAISGTAQVGETLTANTSGIADADGLSNVQYEYQWLADDDEIAGATNATYTLTDSEESKAITVQVSFTDDEGNEETLTSTATDAVSAAPTPNSPATGAPTTSGTAQVGQILTADTSGIADADGLANATFSYQWLADDTDIAGATGLTYTLTDSEESKAITVQVSFTDDEGNEETLTSTATDAVAGAQPTEPPAKPTGLEATASHDSVTLTWDDPGDDSITGYVILRRIPGVDPEGHFDVLVANTGTAATTYTDDTVSAETRYTYRIKAINGAGTSERSRWSHIDVPAAPVPDQPTGLEATESDGQVVLTWDDPGDDSITGYVILRRVRENDTGGDFSVLVADTGTAALTYTDDTVAAGTTYTYRIKAINEHGTSERSRWYHIDIPEAP